MNLPSRLAEAIQQEIENVDRAALTRAAAQLTAQYKSGQFSSPAIRTEAQRAAYLTVRVPATFAADLHVFSEIRRLAPEAELQSMLDLGAGPGTAVLAANEMFSSVMQVTLVEMDSNMIAVGKRMAEKSSCSILRNATWLQRDITQGTACGPHDLVAISYALGELPAVAISRTVLQAWENTESFLVLVEP